jgi:hypothetical protein
MKKLLRIHPNISTSKITTVEENRKETTKIELFGALSLRSRIFKVKPALPNFLFLFVL